MIAIYLMLPLLKKIAAKASQFALGMTTVFLLAFSSLIPTFLDLDPGITFGCINIHLSSAIYPAYLFIGYYLFNHRMISVYADGCIHPFAKAKLSKPDIRPAF